MIIKIELIFLLSFVGLSYQGPISRVDGEENSKSLELSSRTAGQTNGEVIANIPTASVIVQAEESQLPVVGENQKEKSAVQEETLRQKKEISVNELAQVNGDEEELNDEETLQTAESHIFRPVFRFRSAFAERKRIRKRLTTTP